jgi:hypothetical protein
MANAVRTKPKAVINRVLGSSSPASAAGSFKNPSVESELLQAGQEAGILSM